ncbi:MAG: very short patch repair endonuclease [Pseudohongiella sp.]|nr:very short patch repair endonuclease [Pseudohongiella sp.]
MDVVSAEKRSKMMSGIRGKDTRPEILIRKALFNKGFRYALGGAGLPGKPDLVFKKYKAVVFINGCFWHRHECHLFKWPSSNSEFWRKKISANVVRDRANYEACLGRGYRVAIIWECAIKGKFKIPFDVVTDMLATWVIHNELEVEISASDGPGLQSQD